MFNFYVKVFFLILFLLHAACPREIHDRRKLVKYFKDLRNSRCCPSKNVNRNECFHTPPDPSCNVCNGGTDLFDRPFCRHSVLENPFILILLVLLALLFFLVFLGLIKAILGLFSRKIGECGLALLVDLPEPLQEYRESHLKSQMVQYDVVGWPVHPQTKQRTVRVLPAKTEFCLNVIFFLAYPLALILRMCALCCCITNYRNEDDDCFKEVNVVRFNQKASKEKNTKGPQIDVYYENDVREDEDTQYVLHMMKQSQMSLEKNKQNYECCR